MILQNNDIVLLKIYKGDSSYTKKMRFMVPFSEKLHHMKSKFWIMMSFYGKCHYDVVGKMRHLMKYKILNFITP